MAAPEITPLPPAPQPSDTKSVFDAKAFPFVSALATMGVQMNALAAWMESSGVETGDLVVDTAAIGGSLRPGSVLTVNGKSVFLDSLIANGGSGFTNEGATAQLYTNEQGAVVRATTPSAISAQLNFLTTAGSVAGAIDVGTNGGGLMIFKSSAYSTFLATLGVNSFTAAGNQIGVNNINNASSPEIRMQQSGVQRGRIIWPDATTAQILDGSNTAKISYTSSAVMLHNDTTVLGNVQTAGQFNGSGAGLVNIPAANLTGTVSDDRLPTSMGAKTFTGNITAPKIGANTTSLGTDAFRANGTSTFYGAMELNAALNASGLISSVSGFSGGVGAGLTNTGAIAKLLTNANGGVVQSTGVGETGAQLSFVNTAGDVTGAIQSLPSGGGLMLFKTPAYAGFLATMGVNSFATNGNALTINNVNNTGSAPEIDVLHSGVRRGKIVWSDATTGAILDGSLNPKFSYTSSAVVLHSNTTVLGNVTATGQFNGSGAGLTNVPSAALNLISSATDTTVGRIVDNRGWMGLGGDSLGVDSAGLDAPIGNTFIADVATGSSPMGAYPSVINVQANAYHWQIGGDVLSPSVIGFRKRNSVGTWTAYQTFWHTGNTSTAVQSMLGAADSAGIKSAIGLATIASSLDTTANRVVTSGLIDGFFGVGGRAAELDTVDPIDSPAQCGLYSSGSAAGTTMLDYPQYLKITDGGTFTTLIGRPVLSGELVFKARAGGPWLPTAVIIDSINTQTISGLKNFTGGILGASIGVGTSSMGSDIFRVNGSSTFFSNVTINGGLTTSGLIESTASNVRANAVQSRNGFNGVSGANADWGNLIWTAASTWEFRGVGGSRQFGFDGTNITTGIPIVTTAPITTSAPITSTGAGFFYGANRVLGARSTGWGAPTGTASRSSFDTATVTTAQLAERLKALIDDLAMHGLIGA